MDRDPSFSWGFLARLSKVTVPSALDNDKQQVPGSSSSSRNEPQATLKTKDGGQESQEHHVPDTIVIPVEAVIGTSTQRDSEGLQAGLKPPNIPHDAQPASEAHSGGAENTTASRNPFKAQGISRPSLLQHQPVPTAPPQPTVNDSINRGPVTRETTSLSGHPDSSAPPRKSLHGTSYVLQSQSTKEQNTLLPTPILHTRKSILNPPSSESSVPSPIKASKISLFTHPKKIYQWNSLSKSFPLYNTSASQSKQPTGSNASKVYHKGNRSYYTPFDPTSSGVSAESSNPTMDNTTSNSIKTHPTSGEDKLGSSTQPSQPAPKGSLSTPSMNPSLESTPVHSPSHGYLNASPLIPSGASPGKTEPLAETLENDQESRDSELSDVESVESRSLGSIDTDIAPRQSPVLVIADSDEDDEDDDQIRYEPEEDDDGRIDLDNHADLPNNDKPATNPSDLCTTHTRESALDDSAYKWCKGNAPVNTLTSHMRPANIGHR